MFMMCYFSVCMLVEEGPEALSRKARSYGTLDGRHTFNIRTHSISPLCPSIAPHQRFLPFLPAHAA